MKPAGVWTPFSSGGGHPPVTGATRGGKRSLFGPYRVSRSQDGTLQSPQDPLHILYQDEHIMVVNKPSGLLWCPAARRKTKTA